MTFCFKLINRLKLFNVSFIEEIAVQLVDGPNPYEGRTKDEWKS